MFGALDSQSLGPGSMLGIEVCLSILSSSLESSKNTIFMGACMDHMVGLSVRAVAIKFQVFRLVCW